ncbi:MAG: hypothetical protein N3I35_12970 [Clostridia bacterium]|nr:hypothetical protein [Clostridia bacterium]
MYSFKTLSCFNCSSVILNLPAEEVYKLSGLTFLCECCGHENLLTGLEFSKVEKSDPYMYTYSFDNLLEIL